jgi:hypothetical protein
MTAQTSLTPAPRAGPPLILVDGALCDRAMGPNTKLAAHLSSRFTVFTYDRRGAERAATGRRTASSARSTIWKR